MLTQTQIAALQALPVEKRQEQYLKLSNKIASFVILTPDELEELIILRNSLQQYAGALLSAKPPSS
jgi:hypothetical protein